MEIRPLETETDYQMALEEIDRLFDATPGTPEEERLKLLAILVEAYEADHYPILPPDPIDAILHVMDAYQMEARDLIPYIGNLELIVEILSRKQSLTLPMIRNLYSGLGIPAEILIQPSAEVVA